MKTECDDVSEKRKKGKIMRISVELGTKVWEKCQTVATCVKGKPIEVNLLLKDIRSKNAFIVELV